MTPLTHAAVGTLLYKSVRKLSIRNYAWIFAILLALCSHYALDAIPHFEGVVPFPDYKLSYLLTSALGLIGIACSSYLIRRDRDLGIVCAVLFAWIGIGNYTLSLLRIVTAIAGIVIIIWKTKQLKNVGYFIAGFVGILPDLIPSTSVDIIRLHKYFHYKTDLGTLWYVSAFGWPAPQTFFERMHNSYYLAGFGMEMLIEGAIFLGSVYVLTSRVRDSAVADEPITISAELLSAPTTLQVQVDELEETLEIGR